MSGGAPGQACTNSLTSSKPELCIGLRFERFLSLDDLAYILPYILISRAISETAQDAAYPFIRHEGGLLIKYRPRSDLESTACTIAHPMVLR